MDGFRGMHTGLRIFDFFVGGRTLEGCFNVYILGVEIQQ